MNKFILKTSFLFALLIFLFFQGSMRSESLIQNQTKQVMKTQDVSKSLKISPHYGQIPLYFIPNEGQVDEEALFYAKASRYTLWLTEEGLVFDSIRRVKNGDDSSHLTQSTKRKNPKDYTYERDVSRLIFLNSNKNPEVIPLDYTEHRMSYFIGNDKSKWRTNIKTSKAVLYRELYRNIDLKVYGVEEQIEYDFIVKPGGEVSDINFVYKNVEETRIDQEGNLVLKTKIGEVGHTKPVSYQEIEGTRIEVEAKFIEIRKNTYRFEVNEYNKNYELIIDPLVLIYSTYLGGSDWDYGTGIAVDSEGAIYVTGTTYSADFPVYNPIQGHTWIDDIFITKINPEGTALVYSTCLGGGGEDWDSSIALDSSGAVYVTGATWSSDFPTQNPIQGSNAGWVDFFIAKINPSGSTLVYSTYFGGSDFEWGDGGIAVDVAGSVYITGETESVDFPIQNPIQGSHAGGSKDTIITKINSSGTDLVYSTYLGGSERDVGKSIAVDLEGSAYVTGESNSDNFPTKNPFQGSNAGASDVFITKINSSGTALVYSTYLGGSEPDGGYDIAVDSEGAVYAVGVTDSDDFPIQNPIQTNHSGPAGLDDVFITKINPSGNALVYSTYLGGYYDDRGYGIAVDSKGAVYVTGTTESSDFPTKNPFQVSHAGGDTDVFGTKINSSGSAIVYSTYLGGHNDEMGSSISVDLAGNAYLTGDTWSTDFPTQVPFQASNAGFVDAIIAKLYAPLPEPDIKANGSDEPITINQGDTLLVTVHFDSGIQTGEDADWWVLMKTSDPKPNNWYYFDMLTRTWILGRSPTRQGSLFDVTSKKVPKTSGLAPGIYTFYFAVDMAMNGSIDVNQAYYDKVKVTINP